MHIVIGFFLVLAVLLATLVGKDSRTSRIRWGIATFLWACLMFAAANMAVGFNQNIWYSTAAEHLLKSSASALRNGQSDTVTKEFEAMAANLEVTYERRGNFKELAEETAKRLSGSEGK
jgi:hypothetical protein